MFLSDHILNSLNIGFLDNNSITNLSVNISYYLTIFKDLNNFNPTINCVGKSLNKINYNSIGIPV